MFGLLVADFGHLYSVWGLGTGLYWKVHLWSAMDWGNIGFVYAGALTRITFLCGLGVPTGKSAVNQRNGQAKRS